MSGIFPSDRNLQTSDITTNNVSTTKHGFAPKGDGSTTKFLNANGAYSTPSSTSKLVQRVYTTFTGDLSASAAIPNDDTIPQSGEGTEIGTLAITPTSTSNFLLIRMVAPLVSGSGTIGMTIALFKDSGADALQVAYSTCTATGGYGHQLSFEYIQQCSGTSAQTWKIRYGPNSGTMYINRSSAGGLFGSTLPILTFVIEEWAP